MRIFELNSIECGEVLARQGMGRLGCSRDDQPYVVPIHFAYDPERRCLYAFSTVGQKIDWMRTNPKVCVEVEDVTDKNHWTTVLAFGRYQEIGQSPEEAEVRQRALDSFQQRAEWWLPAAARLPTREHHAIVVYRVQVDRMTGRRASRDR
jgi:nitroimidazol reductase NimA-like FMN-containing flavoprotein (pyridoxamine 5'-phosphate oxidase superfamily)